MVFLELNDYSLESIESEHYMMLLNWRNSPQIHSKMLTDHLITETEHFAWLKRIQADPVKRILFFHIKGFRLVMLDTVILTRIFQVVRRGHIWRRRQSFLKTQAYIYFI